MARLHPLLGPLVALALMANVPAPAPAEVAQVPNEQITTAIKQAVGWIYQQQNQWGTWDAREPAGIQRELWDQGQYGFQTALALHTLLSSGESERDARLQPAIDFLITNDRIGGIYAIGMRAQVWPLLTPTPAIRQVMARDRNILLAAMHTKGRTRGLFSFRADFDNEPDYADHSVSFYGTLGLKALADGGIEIPDDFWKTVDRAWRSQQSRDGSWGYQVGAARGLEQEHTMSTAASGVAVLFSTTDELAASRPADCRGAPADRNIENGLTWIDTHFDQSRTEQDIVGFKLFNYALYAVARIGATSGRKYFNQRDWYEDGTRMLLGSQDKTNQSWGNLPDTCFAVLFLVQGRNPVILSKLQYSVVGGSNRTARPAANGKPARQAGGSIRAGNWNLRPRDVANFTDWVGRQVEQQFNWQAVSLKVPVEELHDSAVLYIAGNQSLNLTPQDKAKLKLFVEEGGLLLGNADCASREFSDSFRNLGAELFPMYEFRNVPRNSVIYTGQQYRAAKWKDPPQLLELNNGVRDLMLLIPDLDPSRFFQQRQLGSRQYLYELMADILFYSVDQNGLRLKGESYIVRPDPAAQISRTVKLARLQYDGNWDPEPGGWVRLAAVLRNTSGVDLQVSAIRPGNGLLDSSFRIAHLTGTAKFHLSDAARAEVKTFLDRGGTLVVDAAGGSAAFDAAAQSEIKALLPSETLETLPPDHMLFSSPQKLGHAAYRRFARAKLGQTDAFGIQGIDAAGRTEVFYSPQDLSGGLVGEPIDGINGYQPAMATGLMSNLILHAAAK